MLKKVARYLVRRIHRRIKWFMRKFNYNRRIYINGKKISVPSIRGITCNVTEPWLTDLLGKVLQEQNGAFLDVGVNVGQTLVKLKALDPNRKYIGFEPNPVCVYYVQELIKENSFENCTLFPVGLFIEDCVLPLDLFSDYVASSTASLINKFRPDHRVHSRILVPVFRFDSLAKLVDFKSVGIIKIDVEGAELEVVQSILELIRRDKPIILIEILPVYSEENAFRKNRQDKLEQIFTDTGYIIIRVEKTNTDNYSLLRCVEKI